MMERKFKVSLSPHVRAEQSTSTIMTDVVIALLPACIMAVYFYGFSVALVLAVGVVSAVAAEYAWNFFTKKPQTISDMSAAVTGLLVAMNATSKTPWWVVMLGSFFAIIVCKQFFGGLGQNFINPAMAARAFMLASWPTRMTAFTVPFTDTLTSATPLMTIYGKTAGELPTLMQMFVGNMAGCIGEVSKVALLLGFVYLLFRKVISWRIPVIFIGTVFVLSAAFAGSGFDVTTGLYAILSGGLIMGAVFMATDYVTSPLTTWGQNLYALLCGVIVFLIRKFGALPEGVTYAILLMNIASPLIDKYIKPKKYGEVAKAK
ncbi:MAG: RnfABCDGE type electron transport complex subunit D [Clostridia bacterium]|nr:RnfABCDGE type electron transport complex subunit D [Clostridia bacterium]